MNNRIIAEFMGYTIIPNGTVAENHNEITEDRLECAPIVSYHNDWNLLIDVIKKITDTYNVKVMIDVGSSRCVITDETYSFNLVVTEASYTISAVYQAVVKFLEEGNE